MMRPCTYWNMKQEHEGGCLGAFKRVGRMDRQPTGAPGALATRFIVLGVGVAPNNPNLTQVAELSFRPLGPCLVKGGFNC